MKSPKVGALMVTTFLAQRSLSPMVLSASGSGRPREQRRGVRPTRSRAPRPRGRRPGRWRRPARRPVLPLGPTQTATGTVELDTVEARASTPLWEMTPSPLLELDHEGDGAVPGRGLATAWPTKSASIGSISPLSWMTSMWPRTTAASAVALVAGATSPRRGRAASARDARPAAAPSHLEANDHEYPTNQRTSRGRVSGSRIVLRSGPALHRGREGRRRQDDGQRRAGPDGGAGRVCRALIVEVEGKSGLASAVRPAARSTTARSVLSPAAAGRDGAADVRPAPSPPTTPCSSTSQDHGMRRISKRLASTGALDMVATAAPGIKDILILGKVKQLERAAARGATRRFIVLDAPGRRPRHQLPALAPAACSTRSRSGPSGPRRATCSTC